MGLFLISIASFIERAKEMPGKRFSKRDMGQIFLTGKVAT
jgi:hypothetical protein